MKQGGAKTGHLSKLVEKTSKSMISLNLTQGIIRNLSLFLRKDVTEAKCLREMILKTYKDIQKGEMCVSLGDVLEGEV